MATSHPRISVVIPAFDEAESIGLVIADLPHSILQEIIVVDNGSSDATASVAAAAGARVVSEPRKGYGQACLTGIAATDKPDIIVFLDGDYSDHPEELPDVIRPILDDQADLVIGSRVAEKREPGAMLPQALFGNWLATSLIRLIWGFRYTDLGPFRAVTVSALQRIGMRDTNFGWTVEMQVKALREGLRIAEVPVSYRRRVGVSKITGTVRGTVAAGYKILWTIGRYALVRGPRS
jgi:glycosyltransferase involved in cell wall biosynthesis